MKDKEKQVNGVPFDAELEIFGEHKTKEQIRIEEKARKKAEREALKKEMDRRRQAAKAEDAPPARRKDVLIVILVVGIVFAVCLMALGINSCRSQENGNYAINVTRGQYVDEAAYPDMSGTEPTVAVKKAYFTNGGHLCVEMLISNGTNQVLAVEALDVAAYDYTTGDFIGGGKAELEEHLILKLAAVEGYTFYISPEHLAVGEDTMIPELMEFEVKITHRSVSME